MDFEPAIKKLSRKLGCQLELYSEDSHDTACAAKRDNANSLQFSISGGFGVRAIKDRRMGFAFFEGETGLEGAAKSALKLAALHEKADYYFPSKRKASSKKFYDKRADSLEEGDFLDRVQLLLSTVSSRGAENLEAAFSSSKVSQAIVNSEGLSMGQKFSGFSAMSHCADGEGEGSDFLSSQYDFDPLPLAEKAAYFARVLKTQQAAKPGVYEVIFDTRALADLFELFLSFNFSGETHRKKLSKISIGQKIGGEGVSIHDDPLLPKASSSAQFDDEGMPTTKKTLIENGAVTSFLYDAKTACRVEGADAGNGFRGSYKSTPSISFSNLVVSPGSAGDFVSECKKGVLVYSFLTSGANSVSGDFAFPLHTALLVEKGEKKRALKGAILQGNFFDVLKHMEFEKKRENRNGLLSGRAKFTARIVS